MAGKKSKDRQIGAASESAEPSTGNEATISFSETAAHETDFYTPDCPKITGYEISQHIGEGGMGKVFKGILEQVPKDLKEMLV